MVIGLRRDRESEGDDTPGSGAELVLSVIDAELIAEEQRKESIERRCLAVVTTSGALVTALFALGTLVTRGDKYQAPAASLVVLLVTLLLFTCASIQALRANDVRGYQRIDAKDLRQTALSDIGSLTAAQVRGFAAQTNTKVLLDARRVTGEKATQLRRAILLEVFAVAGLAVAVAILVLESLVPGVTQWTARVFLGT